jgi:hypothetical protein
MLGKILKWTIVAKLLAAWRRRAARKAAERGYGYRGNGEDS